MARIPSEGAGLFVFGTRMYFEDRATLDTKTKRVISMRDGVLEYLGAELGKEPADAVFTVWRSPATLANAAMQMEGVPVVDGHVSTDGPAPETGSYVLDSQVLTHLDDATMATLVAGHHAEVTDELAASIEGGKRQVSLGYTAELVENEEHGLEQVNITPHHLATEQAGRCGPSCSFIDHRAPNGADEMPKDTTGDKSKMHQAFLDENGEVNMQQIVEIASKLPEAIKAVPVDKLQEVMPQLQELVSIAGTSSEETGSEEQDTTDEDDPNEVTDPDDPDEEEPMGDKDRKGKQDKAPQGYTDEQVRKFADAQSQQAVKRHAEVIDKARYFLGEEYDFKDKSTEQIMRDAIATESSESFEDAELPMAFKILKPSQHRAEIESFGDRDPNTASKLDQIAEKEL